MPLPPPPQQPWSICSSAECFFSWQCPDACAAPLCLLLLTPGFTVVDVLGLGAMGHVVGVGLVLGLRAVGAI